MQKFDVVIIGGGSGGLNVAVGATSLGAKVALIENSKLGGDCLHYGCVPSKTLIKSAKVAHLAKNSKKYGINATLNETDYSKVAKRISDVIETIQVHDSKERFEKLGITVFLGNAEFSSKNTLKIKTHEGEEKEIKFKKCTIATGSHPFVPPIKGLDEVNYFTNMNIFEKKKLPKRLGVVGGGPIGSEISQAFARLGSKVTIFEGSSHILSREDDDVSNDLMKVFTKEGVRIKINTHVIEVKKKGNEKILVTEDENKNQSETIVDEILVATGQRPATSNLGLENAKVKLTDRKAIQVDKFMRTSNKRVYACGDVVGSYQFTHIAEHQAKVIVWNLFFPKKKKIDYSVVPWCTYTDPELSHVGLTQRDLEKKENKGKYKIYTFPGKDIDRFQAEGYEEGFAKIIVDKRGNIKGVTLLLPTAGELIHEFVLAMNKGLKAQDISSIIHVYPTMADANKRVVNQFMGDKYLTPFSKKLAKFFFRLKP